MSILNHYFSEAALESDDFARDDQRERWIYNVTEDLLVLMDSKGVSKAGLAKKLGKSKPHISQLLKGNSNMTLGTFSDICFALGVTPKVTVPGVQHIR